MKEEFKKQVEGITAALKESLPSNGDWRLDLRATLNHAITFSEKQVQAIADAATLTTLKDVTGVETSLAKKLTHAFEDPVSNSISILTSIKNGYIEDDEAIVPLIQLKNALEDINHNYPLILGGETPDTTLEIIETYKSTIIPQLENVIAGLADETGIDPQNIKPQDNWQHLSALPNNFESLG